MTATIPQPVTDWTVLALCAQTDPELWFPERGHFEQSQVAKAVCGRCPVRGQCLAEAMTRRLWSDDSGIWGGLSPRERRELARGAGRAA